MEESETNEWKTVLSLNLLAARAGTREQTTGGRGEREEETEGGAAGAGEAAEGGRGGERRFYP